MPIYTILKYIAVACNALIAFLLLISNNTKKIDDPSVARATINATWMMVIVLGLNTALLLAGQA